MPVLNELDISFSNNIWLNSLVSMGTMMGLAALKCSYERPYSLADFPLFSLSIAGPTSASEIVNTVSLFVFSSASISLHLIIQSSKNTLSKFISLGVARSS